MPFRVALECLQNSKIYDHIIWKLKSNVMEAGMLLANANMPFGDFYVVRHAYCLMPSFYLTSWL
jgi:hypothetical protein